jgi:hypothetical protein
VIFGMKKRANGTVFVKRVPILGRVTRLGEFSPNGRLLTSSRCFENTEENAEEHFWLHVFTVKIMLQSRQKMYWATFWAIFSAKQIRSP